MALSLPLPREADSPRDRFPARQIPREADSPRGRFPARQIPREADSPRGRFPALFCSMGDWRKALLATPYSFCWVRDDRKPLLAATRSPIVHVRTTMANRWSSCIVVPRGCSPFGQHQESRPLDTSSEIPVLIGFANKIE